MIKSETFLFEFVVFLSVMQNYDFYIDTATILCEQISLSSRLIGFFCICNLSLPPILPHSLSGNGRCLRCGGKGWVCFFRGNTWAAA